MFIESIDTIRSALIGSTGFILGMFLKFHNVHGTWRGGSRMHIFFGGIYILLVHIHYMYIHQTSSVPYRHWYLSTQGMFLKYRSCQFALKKVDKLHISLLGQSLEPPNMLNLKQIPSQAIFAFLKATMCIETQTKSAQQNYVSKVEFFTILYTDPK